MKEKILYFDCLSGISGDMAIGALLDLGVDRDKFTGELNKLNLSGYTLSLEKGKKNGITGVDVKVLLDQLENHHQHENHHHRNLQAIEDLIEGSELNESVKTLSKKIFREVAVAEAKVHDLGVEEVHFHEVGAIDSIVDIVGVSILIDMLQPDCIFCSPLHVGTGFVKCEHGMIPVPAPATLEILKGVPIYSMGIRSELVTPTGAAIVKVLATEFIPAPLMEIEKVGYGLGNKDLEITNTLRVILGKKKAILSSW